MISNRIRKAIQISVFAAGAALAGGAAQAAAYTGTWDPPYGSAFQNLSWGGEAKFYIPDACLSGIPADSEGWVLNSAACSANEMKITSGYVDLKKNTQTDQLTFDPTYSIVTAMQVVNHNLVGIKGGFLMPMKSTEIASLKHTYFWLAFDGGPAMFHVNCSEDLGSKKGAVWPIPSTSADLIAVQSWLGDNYSGECNIHASKAGWNSSNQDGTGDPGPLLWSAAGKLTNDAGTINVPEPASLALVLSALGAGWVARRRRSS